MAGSTVLLSQSAAQILELCPRSLAHLQDCLTALMQARCLIKVFAMV